MDNRASVRAITLLCQLTLNELSNFTIPYLPEEPRPLGRKSSIGRVASRITFSQASKTSVLLNEMGVVSTICTMLASASSPK